MLPHNKKLLFYIGALFLVLYVIISLSVYYVLNKTAITQNQQKLHNILLYEQAQKHYIDNVQKKYIYTLQKKHLLPENFFTPELMSATYITRHTLKEYNKLRRQNNMPEIKYKIASDNPRNPVNKANKEELSLLKKFNSHEISSYSKKIVINNKDYIYYAVPVIPNNEICMRCHGDPEKAPKDLVKKYGNKAGFHEKIGHIRAFFSLALPLDEEYKFVNKITTMFDIILLTLFILTYVIIYFIVKKLDNKDKQIIETSYKDGLTNIYNRKKFNQDIIEYSKIIENSYLMLIDIDHFKKINDSFGHPIGDKILVELTSLISKNIRCNDKFYRIGGEEFAIISTQKNNIEEKTFANKIKSIIENHNFKFVGKVTISIGFTKLKPKETYHQWYKRADEALYEAKKTRNTIVEK